MSAIRLEAVKGPVRIARVYASDNPGPMDPYVASFVLEWQGAREVWIKALQGRMGRREWRAVLQLAVSLGVHTILAKRAPGHVLPLATPREDGTLAMDVRALSHRFATPGSSDFVDLDPPVGEPA